VKEIFMSCLVCRELDVLAASLHLDELSVVVDVEDKNGPRAPNEAPLA